MNAALEPLMRVVRRALPMLAALLVGGFAMMLAPSGSFTPLWLPIALAVGALAWVLFQPLDAQRDDLLPALAALLTCLGLTEIARLSPLLAHKQLWWCAIALAVVLVLSPMLTNFRRMASYKYIWVLASLILFVLLVVVGHEVNGARLWIAIGPLHLEPVEFIKLFIVFFLAAYLAEMGDVIADAKPWSLRANAKYLGPLFLGWGASTAILIVQRDLGMAALLLATFATMLYAATRRIDIVLGGLAIFGVAALWALHRYTYVQTRVGVWLHPFAHPLGRGYQAAQSYYSLAAGGLLGTGYRLGHPGFIPDVATDYIYAAFSEEFGLIGAIVILALYVALVRRILVAGLERPDLYAKLLAVGLSATLGFQVAIIVGGVIGLFPLTGITLPFVSYGGSSLVANAVLIALAWSLSARPRRVAPARVAPPSGDEAPSL
ncbi:MAG: FtsW/RodA/SpoVE family cell cycle protein [Vulcanimicrobiaceae bacterium]